MSRTLIIATLLLSVATCGKKKKEAAPPGAPEEAAKAAAGLWALAPADAVGGFVVSPGTLRRAQASLAELQRVLSVGPGGKALAAKMGALFAGMPLNPLDTTAINGAGIDLEQGMAIFFDGTARPTMVLPVADRAGFRKAFGGRIEEVEGREVDRLGELVCAPSGDRYACGSSVEALGGLGKSPGGELAQKVAGLPAELRGDAELVVDFAKFPGVGNVIAALVSAPTTGSVAFRLGGGGGSLRAWVGGTPTAVQEALVAPPSNLPKRALEEKHVTGIFRVGVSRKGLGGSGLPAELPGGIRADMVVENLTGEMVGYTPSDGPLLVVEVGIESPEMFEKLLAAAYDSMATAIESIPWLEVQREEGHYEGTLNLSLMEAVRGLPAIDQSVRFTLAVERDRLVGSFQLPVMEVGGKLPPTPVGRDLATNQWGFAVWGQALHYELPDVAIGVSEYLAAAEDPELVHWGSLAYWMALHVYELGIGFGARPDGLHLLLHATTFAADPEEIYREYERGVKAALDGDRAAAEAALSALREKAPDTLAGRQLASRSGSGILAAGALGMVAAVAIPAFVKYVRKSKTSEAREFVHRIYLGAQQYYAESQTYPPSVPLTPPDPTKCCEKCPPSAELWAHPTWTALMFSVDDPHYYAYEFENRGDALVARARGDLDCDGELSTFEIRWTKGSDSPEMFVDKELE